MKASPARIGDYIEFFSEIDLLAGLSACPGGDCSLSHSSDDAVCYSLKVEIYECLNNDLKNLLNVNKNKSEFVAVLVNPSEKTLEEIKNFNKLLIFFLIIFIK